jgi:tripartite-type tricarboxylate transporter receptor subunit TctC
LTDGGDRAVPDGSPYKSLKDVVEAARKNPGKLNLGAINPGSTQNLSAYLLQQVTGATFTIVPYRTTPDLMTALLRGDVDVGFDFYAGFESEIGLGKLRIIATSGEQRDPLLKDVPTAIESGFTQYVVTSWNGVAAPAGVPADVVKVLNADIVHALTAPGLQEKAIRLGMEAHGSTPEEMHDRMAGTLPSGTTSSRRPEFQKSRIPFNLRGQRTNPRFCKRGLYGGRAAIKDCRRRLWPHPGREVGRESHQGH